VGRTLLSVAFDVEVEVEVEVDLDIDLVLGDFQDRKPRRGSAALQRRDKPNYLAGSFC
jgi:hypothetical protein